jgi:hypothetical protein
LVSDLSAEVVTMADRPALAGVAPPALCIGFALPHPTTLSPHSVSRHKEFLYTDLSLRHPVGVVV